MWDKKFSTENLDTPPSPLIHKLLRCRKLSETQHRRVHLQNFSALWDKKFSTENLDTPPSPLLSIHFFATGNVLKHSTEGFTYKIFRHCETKNFRPKILILPPPLLSINFFATGNFLKHNAEGFLYEMFRYCKTKNFRRKILILPPPLWSINFFAAGNFLKHSTEGFTYKIFRHCETKNFRPKILILPPPPSYPYTFSLPETFWNTAQKASPTKFFGTVRQKIFDGNWWHIPLNHKVLRHQKFFETPKGSPTKFFGTVRQFSTENLDTPPSPLIHKLFRCRKLSETQHRRVHLQNFSALWDKKFSTKILILPPPLLSINFFATGNFLKHTAECFNYEIFRQCETKNFRRKILILPPPPSYPYTFSLPEIFWNTPPNVSTTKFFGNVGQKIFDGKSWYSPLPSYP